MDGKRNRSGVEPSVCVAAGLVPIEVRVGRRAGRSTAASYARSHPCRILARRFKESRHAIAVLVHPVTWSGRKRAGGTLRRKPAGRARRTSHLVKSIRLRYVLPVPRPLVHLLVLLIALHAPIAGAAVSPASCGNGDAAMHALSACPDCAGPADPASGDPGCPMGGMVEAQCIAPCAGMSGLPGHAILIVQRAAGDRIAGPPCERLASLARDCPRPPPRIPL